MAELTGGGPGHVGIRNSQRHEVATNAFVGLGSNLNDPRVELDGAIKEMDAIEATRVVLRSSYYRTAPVGFVDQPDFINAVCGLVTGLAATVLLTRLLQIEASHGRTRGPLRNGPRSLDLDLLLYGDECIDEPGLTVPHPRIAERRFVLEPLAEIAPGLHISGQGQIMSLLARCPSQTVVRLETHANVSSNA